MRCKTEKLCSAMSIIFSILVEIQVVFLLCGQEVPGGGQEVARRFQEVARRLQEGPRMLQEVPRRAPVGRRRGLREVLPHVEPKFNIFLIRI